jgi:hypothetical protein
VGVVNPEVLDKPEFLEKWRRICGLDVTFLMI